MKILDWYSFFTEQRAMHGKVVFSVVELANAVQTTLHAPNTELGRLVRRGLITRSAQGRYGLIRGVAPEDIVPEVDPGAYVTGFLRTVSSPSCYPGAIRGHLLYRSSPQPTDGSRDPRRQTEVHPRASGHLR